MIDSNTIVGGRYRVVKSLGGGGMKLVYLAEDLRLAARRCALAEMVDSFTSPDAQKQAIAAFQREADMLAQLSNEHIPRVFDRFSEANHHYLVMEYIDGVTLEDELNKSGGKLPAARVIDIALQILDTLQYLHHLDPPVIYRDLKPSNVMVTAEGKAKLIDFGIARFFQPLANATMIGTQGYAPPEQYRGRVEARSDLYALGATMHHAISGRDPALEPPFSFPPLRKLCPDIDSRLAAVIDKALSYDVVNRMHDADEFKRRLLEIKTGPLGAAGAQPSPSASAVPHQRMAPPPGGSQPSPAGPNPAGGRAAPARPGGSLKSNGPSAPTVLSVAMDITCPGCGAKVPADSRFCSYCRADLRSTPGVKAPAAAPNDDTVLLSASHAPQHPAPSLSWPADSRAPRVPYRRNWFRRPLVLIVLIFIAAFVVAKLIIQSNAESTTPSGYSEGRNDSGVGSPPARTGIAPGDDSASGLDPVRATIFRQALNLRGYRNVRFRMDGDTMILQGTVPTQWDRAQILILAQGIGVSSLEDNLVVTGSGDDFGG
jgi:serine/threonine protein kinase